MAYDVVVVGGGIGGLAVAALLSARGVNVCLFERQSQVGGCVARVEFGGREFEPGMGIYTSFGAGEIYDRIFSELPVEVPRVSLITQPYVVRLADGTDIRLTPDDDTFLPELTAAFPEWSAVALKRARGPLYSIEGGPAAVAERLAESIKRSGGTVRLNTPVLRLAYDQSGAAIGVDLLSGERVVATRAIVSNLTIWDTYGKLVGLNRTPPEIKKQLNTLHGTGAFVVYASIEQPAVARLPGERLLVAHDPSALNSDNPFTEFTLAIQGSSATLKTTTEVDEWFAYHASEEDFEESDQEALERFWTRIHASLPELGADIEVIETANPRTYYDLTRRKLGMVMGVPTKPDAIEPAASRTFLPNLFMVGDTVSAAPFLEDVVEAAVSLANQIRNS